MVDLFSIRENGIKTNIGSSYSHPHVLKDKYNHQTKIITSEPSVKFLRNFKILFKVFNKLFLVPIFVLLITINV